MATTYYTVPGFDRYGYSTSASTSPAPDDYEYYLHPYGRAPPSATPPKRHHVRTTSYTPPRTSVWQGTSPLGAPQYYTATPRRPAPPPAVAYEHVSPALPRRRRASTAGPEARPTAARRTSIRLPTRQYVVDPESESDWDWDQPLYQEVRPRATRKKAAANPVPVQVDLPVRSRARRSSAAATTVRPASAAAAVKADASPPAKASKASKGAAAVATAADAASHNIPAGYVLKHWDPTERPVLLLGSVFDANSLGKWIYDWTVYTHHAGSPLAEMAGELWLMLIKFSHKMKRAAEGVARVRGRDNRRMVAEFQESGDRLWRRLVNLLKVCEDFMWRVAKRASTAGPARMGEKSGVEFVKTIFGRDRELEETERLMSSMRLWLMRFDANCEDLLRSRKH